MKRTSEIPSKWRTALPVVVLSFIMFVYDNTNAQANPCGKRGDIVDSLARKYGEEPVALGLANNGGVLEVLISKESGNWTIIITFPEGDTCLIAAGENWDNHPIKTTGLRH